ncbi:MAG: tRNA (adenosine(37)-N6)-threonylcarbamoyltransferase complex ATPase subunit type 1 TsaE [Rhodobiaceae bacterium]|nr:MAG: tRNA (adenosine(37)-N6)-threonylcarbamoyltransferase complex ATPase subunit type 1 TsaE [Rhodobiaceae bacterium]
MNEPAASPEIKLNLPDAAATDRLGQTLARHVGAGDVIALSGDLGAGKTSLARALIQALLAVEGRQEDVPSPTFTLVQTYETAKLTIWHADLYRLNNPREVDELGLEDAHEGGLLLIEWPDRMGDELPRERLEVELKESGGKDGLKHAPKDGRSARLTSWGGTWDERIRRVAAEFVD